MHSILITGCSSGFGYDSAIHFADKGHKVYATMRGTTGKNQAAAERLSAHSDNIRVVELDVCSDASVNAAAQEVGAVDVVINNAGFGLGGALETLSTSQFQHQMDVNVTGVFRVCSAFLPSMRKQGHGLFIQVSSIAGRLAAPGFGAYYASKWALEGLSESLYHELAPLGIDVSIVEPGPFATNFLPNIVPPQNDTLASAYGHVEERQSQFVELVQELLADENAPTDPSIVVDLFDELINMAPGTRPLRTVSGLDFGVRAINDAIEAAVEANQPK